MKQVSRLIFVFFLIGYGVSGLSEAPSEAARIEKISPFFTPKPGGFASLDPAEIRDQEKRRPAEDLKGYIKVNPPKGSCFYIQRAYDLPDEKICKSSVLSFKVGDIDPSGRIVWRLSTSGSDQGIALRWLTPYRIAQVIPYSKNEKEPRQHRIIKTCELKSEIPGIQEKQRRLHIELFGGEEWVLNFPEKDSLVSQPPPVPNLHIMKPGRRIDGTGGPKGLTKNTGFDEDDDDAWVIPSRDTYIMSASNFITSDSGPPGNINKCRYQLKNAPEDPESGWIECHHTDRYQIVYTHIPCAKEILQKKP